MLAKLVSVIKRAVGIGEPSASSIVWQRERRVLQALRVAALEDQPYNLAGRYSWLTSPWTGCELQIDIFFPKITHVAGTKLVRPESLAIEVQSTLHDGKWTSSKRRFFRSKEDFDHYTRNQEWKRKQILARHIPFIEIDPDKDDLSPKTLRRAISKALGLL